MNRFTLLTLIALATIATLAGGAAFHLGELLALTAASATLGFVVVVVLAGLVLGSGRSPRGRTPYWH